MGVKDWIARMRGGFIPPMAALWDRIARHRVWIWAFAVMAGYFGVTYFLYSKASSANLEILEAYFWDESSESIRNLALVIGGWLGLLAAIIGFVLSGFRTKAANQQAEAALKQTETVFQSLVTERFTRAVEQLGHEKRAVRLGAIYALERIAKDSARDRDTIVETLAAYIRENAPKKPHDKIGQPLDEAALRVEAVRADMRPPIDIAAALTVLCGLLPTGDSMREKVDLRHTDLRGFDAPGIDLDRARLDQADLYGAHLGDANLSGAFLSAANLSRAYVSETNLSGAYLGDANLNGANLGRANLSGAFLADANLSEANLRSTNLSEVSGLSQEQIDGIRYHRNYPPENLPEGLTLPEPNGP